MSAIDKFGVYGNVTLVLRDGVTGRIKAVRKAKNMKVYGTFNLIASALCEPSTTQKSVVFLGIGSGPDVASSDTALSGEVWSRTVGRYSHDANTPQWNLSWSVSGTTGNAVSIQQMGIFTSLTGGVLYLKATFATLTIDSGDILNAEWLQSLASA